MVIRVALGKQRGCLRPNALGQRIERGLVGDSTVAIGRKRGKRPS